MAKQRFEPYIPGRLITEEEARRDVPLRQPLNTGRSVMSFDPEDYSRVNSDIVIGAGLRGLQEARALDQGTFELFAKGIGNVVGSFAQELIASPGYLFEASPLGLFTEGMDNAWIRGAQWLRENTIGQFTEVYQRPSVMDSPRLLDHLLDGHFWAKEAADGVGFMLSFLMPGQILKAANAGQRVMRGLTRLGKLSDTVVDGTRMLEAGQANRFGRLLMKTAGRTGRATDFGGTAVGWGKAAANVDSALAVGVNTLIESAAEGADMYDQLIEQGYSTEEAGRRASQVFALNIGTLAVSNTFIEKYLFNGFNRMTDKPLYGLVSDIVKGATPNMRRRAAGKLAQGLVQGVASEGLWEEGMQTTIQQVATEEGVSVGEAITKYVDNLGSLFSKSPDIEFAKAAILGGMLGGGMTTVGAIGDARAERAFLEGKAAYSPGRWGKLLGRKEHGEIPGAVAMVRSALDGLREDISTLYTKKDDGSLELKPDAIQRLKDGTAINLLQAYYHDLVVSKAGNTEEANVAFMREISKVVNKPDEALELWKLAGGLQLENNEEALAFMRHASDQQYFNKFLRLQGGDKLLIAHIDDAVELMAERYESNTGVKMSEEEKASLREEMKAKGEIAIRQRKTVERDHDQLRIDFMPKDLNEEEQAAFDQFWATNKAARLGRLSWRDYFGQRIQELNKEREEILKDEKNVRDSASRNERQQELDALEQTIAQLEKEASMTLPGAKTRQVETTARLDAARKEYNKLAATVKMMTTKIDKRAAELTKEVDKLLNYYNEAYETTETDYKALSQRTGLRSLWEQQRDAFVKRPESATKGEEQSEESASAEETGPDKTESVEKVTWEDFTKKANAAGYTVGDPMLIDAGKASYVVETRTLPSGEAYLTISNYDDPTRRFNYNDPDKLFKAFPDLKIVDKAAWEKRDGERKVKRAEQQARLRLDATVGALRQSIADMSAAMKVEEKAIGEAHSKIKKLNRELLAFNAKFAVGKRMRESMGKEAFYAERDRMRREVRDLEAGIKAKQNQINALGNRVAVLRNFREQVEKGIDMASITESRSEQLAALRERLGIVKDAERSLDSVVRLIEDLKTVIGRFNEVGDQLRRRESLLSEVLRETENTEPLIGATVIGELAEKYTWTNPDTNYTKTLKFEGPLSERDAVEVREHLERVAEQRGMDTDVLLGEFKNDYEQLRIAHELNELSLSSAELLMNTQGELSEFAEAMDNLGDELRALKLEATLLAHEEMRGKLNETYKKIEAALAASEDPTGWFIPDDDDGDATISEKGLAKQMQGALSNELFGTTGNTIGYDFLTGEDRWITLDDGTEIPEVTESEQQRRWALWVDRMTLPEMKKNYNVQARTAYYDEQRDGPELALALFRENREKRTPLVDTYVYVTDKEGNLVYVDSNGVPVDNPTKDDLPLLRFVRKSITKFPPDGKNVKMNQPSLLNMYFSKALRISTLDSGMMTSPKRVKMKKAHAEEIAKVLNKKASDIYKMTYANLMEALWPHAVSWGRALYDQQLEIIKTNTQNGQSTPISLYGITKGHPVYFRKDGEAIRYEPRKSLELEVKDGKPANFSIGKVGRNGILRTSQAEFEDLEPGGIYIVQKGLPPLQIEQRNLNDEEVETVMHLLYEFSLRTELNLTTGMRNEAGEIMTSFDGGPQKVTIAKRNYTNNIPILPGDHGRYSLMTTLINWGRKSKDVKVRTPFDINISKGILYYGVDGRIMMSKLRKAVEENDMEPLEPLIDFLKTKRRHVNYSLLTEAQSTANFMYPHPRVNNGVLEIVYRPYIDEVLDSSFTTVPPDSLLKKHGLPRMAQRNLQFNLLTMNNMKSQGDRRASEAPPSDLSGAGERPVPTPPPPSDISAEVIRKAKAGEDVEVLARQAFKRLDDEIGGKLEPSTIKRINRMFKALVEEVLKANGVAVDNNNAVAAITFEIARQALTEQDWMDKLSTTTPSNIINGLAMSGPDETVITMMRTMVMKDIVALTPGMSAEERKALNDPYREDATKALKSNANDKTVGILAGSKYVQNRIVELVEQAMVPVAAEGVPPESSTETGQGIANPKKGDSDLEGKAKSSRFARKSDKKAKDMRLGDKLEYLVKSGIITKQC